MQNGVKALSTMVFKKSVFCQKAQNVHFGPCDLVQISPACGLSANQKNFWSDFRLPASTFATVARKSFNAKFTAKIAFYVTSTDADIGSLERLFIYTLF